MKLTQILCCFPSGETLIGVYVIGMSQNNVYFLSDVHLQIEIDEAEHQKRQRLFALLDKILAEKATLVIVGDWFDFYFEYDYVITKSYFDIFVKMKQLTDAGIKIYLHSGNHDYWLGAFLTETIGVEVFHDPVTLTFSNQSFHLHHGDGLSKDDYKYRIMKRVIRHPATIWLFKQFHPDWGHRLAKLVSYKSREYTKETIATLEARIHENRAYAQTLFSDGIDHFVTGHIHLPRIETLDNHTFLTIGDFINHYSYGLFDGKTLSLNTWEPTT